MVAKGHSVDIVASVASKHGLHFSPKPAVAKPKSAKTQVDELLKLGSQRKWIKCEDSSDRLSDAYVYALQAAVRALVSRNRRTEKISAEIRAENIKLSEAYGQRNVYKPPLEEEKTTDVREKLQKDLIMHGGCSETQNRKFGTVATTPTTDQSRFFAA